eukprot:TRINITY_DN6604_c0_g1_i18.p1 TRINITY_DN6604_c0_g1~~TRINITY_DN6604_c0_g1_i18.p1  ORF type:complete len:549 (-),score=58.31 TRINITY_DN6604_c0_g1_i18:869-2515(-)
METKMYQTSIPTPSQRVLPVFQSHTSIRCPKIVLQTPKLVTYKQGTILANCQQAEEETKEIQANEVAQEQITGNQDPKNVSLRSFHPEDYLEVKDIRKHSQPRQSPFIVDNNKGGGFVSDKDRVTLRSLRLAGEESASVGSERAIQIYEENELAKLPPWAIRSGPRATIYHDPSKVNAAVVTCGGLCPGLNDVVQNIVYTLTAYGVPEENILGIRYGLRGFSSNTNKPVTLTQKYVEGIHLKGGTILGTSRGGSDITQIVKTIDFWGLNMVFVIGGNGGNAAANAIHEECERQGVVCSVVGVPKSIDNDILIIDRCFGFDTAVDEAQRALLAAHVEARSARRGVGLVKLMGRQSGFIAMQASMAAGVVDICLIPEIKFELASLIDHVQCILQRKGYCVICLAEGAGQDLVKNSKDQQFDASGNPILKDIGYYLRESLKTHFKSQGNPIDLKYTDPTYMIRAIPTIPNDRIYCKILGQGAVHGAFAGYTDFTVGLVNTHYVYLPIPQVIQRARVVNPKGRQWNRLVVTTGQPDLNNQSPCLQVEEKVLV